MATDPVDQKLTDCMDPVQWIKIRRQVHLEHLVLLTSRPRNLVVPKETDCELWQLEEDMQLVSLTLAKDRIAGGGGCVGAGLWTSDIGRYNGSSQLLLLLLFISIFLELLLDFSLLAVLLCLSINSSLTESEIVKVFF